MQQPVCVCGGEPLMAGQTLSWPRRRLASDRPGPGPKPAVRASRFTALRCAAHHSLACPPAPAVSHPRTARRPRSFPCLACRRRCRSACRQVPCKCTAAAMHLPASRTHPHCAAGSAGAWLRACTCSCTTCWTTCCATLPSLGRRWPPVASRASWCCPLRRRTWVGGRLGWAGLGGWGGAEVVHCAGGAEVRACMQV